MPAFRFLGEEGRWRLDAALALPSMEYYASDCDATAAMFVALVQDHPFQDGNKRYAIVATTVFLMLNGRLCTISNDEWEILALSVARSDIHAPELSAFLSDRMHNVIEDPKPDEGWLDFFAAEAGKEVVQEMITTVVALDAHVKRLQS